MGTHPRTSFPTRDPPFPTARGQPFLSLTGLVLASPRALTSPEFLGPRIHRVPHQTPKLSGEGGCSGGEGGVHP